MPAMRIWSGLAAVLAVSLTAAASGCGDGEPRASRPLANTAAPPSGPPHEGPVALPTRSFVARSPNAAPFASLDLTETVTPGATPDTPPTSAFVLRIGSGAVYATTVYSLAGDLDPSGRAPNEVWGKVFRSPAGTPVVIHKVTSQTGAGFCGAAKAAYLALAEHARADGRTVVQIAAFAGPDAPGARAGAANLCAVFDFDAPSP